MKKLHDEHGGVPPCRGFSCRFRGHCRRHGGEPTLNPHFPEMIRYLAKARRRLRPISGPRYCDGLGDGTSKTTRFRALAKERIAAFSGCAAGVRSSKPSAPPYLQCSANSSALFVERSACLSGCGRFAISRGTAVVPLQTLRNGRCR